MFFVSATFFIYLFIYLFICHKKYNTCRKWAHCFPITISRPKAFILTLCVFSVFLLPPASLVLRLAITSIRRNCVVDSCFTSTTSSVCPQRSTPPLRACWTPWPPGHLTSSSTKWDTGLSSVSSMVSVYGHSWGFKVWPGRLSDCVLHVARVTLSQFAVTQLVWVKIYKWINEWVSEWMNEPTNERAKENLFYVYLWHLVQIFSTKVSPDVTPSGWLGSKHKLTNLTNFYTKDCIYVHRARYNLMLSQANCTRTVSEHTPPENRRWRRSHR